jgi:hypothetical protein
VSDQPPVDPTLTGGLPPILTGSVGTNTPEPSAISVGKYQTIGGQYVFKGVNHPRVVEGTVIDEKTGKPRDAFLAVDSNGSIMTDPKTGKPQEDQAVTDRSGNPMRIQAAYSAPEGAPVNVPSPAGVTSRIEPGSQAAQMARMGPARYNPGDEASVWFSMPAEQRAQVMQAMVDKGLQPSSGSSTGIDQSWVNAFQTVLGYANANNMPWDQALQFMPSASQFTTKNVTPGTYNIHLTASQDLAAIYKKAFASVIGGGAIPQSEIDAFVRNHQDMERQDQQAQIDAQEKARFSAQQVTIGPDGQPVSTQQPAGTDILGSLPDSGATAAGPVSTGQPSPYVTTSSVESPDQAAIDAIKQLHPQQANATSQANAYSLFMNSISRVGAGAPSTQGTVT